MTVLSDSIELFIKELLEQSDEVSLQRNELAQHFACAPSQINYVLSTRFTLDRGYIIASRRGGGGYIRVVRVVTDRENPLHELACRIGESLSQRDAHAMIARLFEEQEISAREAKLMLSAVDGCTLPTQGMTDGSRARILRGMLTALLQEE